LENLLESYTCPIVLSIGHQAEKDGIERSAGLFEVVWFVANPGAGSFIDIAHDAQKLIFAGTFTTGGLSVSFDGKSSLVRWLRSHNGTVYCRMGIK
jgi:hypothetical protein